MSVLFSPHFSLLEFALDEPIPAECYPIFTRLCLEILEPVRAKFGPQRVMSGYRDEATNASPAVHGQPDSEHIATKDKCAGDIEPLSASPRDVFDWMRGPECASMPFHQLILEHGANGSSVIHVSINQLKPGVRSVLEGATHNSEPYTPVDHVAYRPNVPPLAPDLATQV